MADRPTPPEPKPPGGPGSAFGLLVFAFGLAAGLMIAFAGTGLVEQGTGLILTIFLAALVVIALTGALIFLFRRQLLRKVTGVAEVQLETFAEPLARVAQGAIDRDPRGATLAARDFAQLALARYGWIATRRWVVASLTGLIAAMAALAGTALLFRQNALIEAQSGLLSDQNARIADQTALIIQQVQLAEAERNAAIAVEITGIAAEVGRAAERSARRFAAEGSGGAAPADPAAGLVNVLDPMTDLDRGLMLRIVSASRAARPYRFLDTGLLPDDPGDKIRVAMAARAADLPGAWDRMVAAYGWTAAQPEARLIDRPQSPERGQLLQVLMFGGLRNLEVLNHFGMDLSFAWLPNADLIFLTGQGARLSYADFSGSHLRGSDLGGAMLENTRWRRTWIEGSDFSVVEADRLRPPFEAGNAPMPSFLTGADFSDAVLIDTRFRGATLTAADLRGALILRCDLRDASLAAADLRGAVLLASALDGADLKSVDLDGAIVFGADPLAALAAAARPETFRADRYRVEPVTLDDVMALGIVNRTLERAEVEAAAAGAPPARLVRERPLED